MKTYKYYIYRPALISEQATVRFEAENEEHSLQILKGIISGTIYHDNVDIEYDNDFITYTDNEVEVYNADGELILHEK